MNITKLLDSDGVVRVGIVEDDQVFPLRLFKSFPDLAAILAAENPMDAAMSLSRDAPIAVDSIRQWLPPIDQQEVWAAGVTYLRSQTARMEESEAAASCYDLVYQADRPELFFKATPSRTSGHGGALRIRKDATWNVPEPEITLALSPDMRIVGLTVGNDMSSRDIEGENPLYLPQAKCYDQCAGLGPWITLIDALPSRESLTVDLAIHRNGEVVFGGHTSAAEMARDFEDLVGWLKRDNTMPKGAFLMTGTGIVPDNDFTLMPGDRVEITIGGVGTLSNTIVQG
ncbi:MAG: fumarylacetoacetate hydrolase family protein [Planctomycetota bacterium]